MAQIINLRTRRKQSARDAARQHGAEQAAKHGVSKPERELIRARTDKAARDLDAHRLSDPPAPKVP